VCGNRPHFVCLIKNLKALSLPLLIYTHHWYRHKKKKINRKLLPLQFLSFVSYRKSSFETNETGTLYLTRTCRIPQKQKKTLLPGLRYHQPTLMLASLSFSHASLGRLSQRASSKRRQKAVSSNFLIPKRSSTRNLIIDSKHGNSTLFPCGNQLGARNASFCRVKRSHITRHGGHGHHHHKRDHGYPLISGIHAEVDPRLFNQTLEEDHAAGTKITVYGIVVNIALSIGYVLD
jgi:hypothetical protein